jgi:hypothetical protein
LPAGGRPSRTVGNGLCPSADRRGMPPLTVARPAGQNRKQRVRRRRTIATCCRARCLCVVLKKSPHCQVSAFCERGARAADDRRRRSIGARLPGPGQRREKIAPLSGREGRRGSPFVVPPGGTPLGYGRCFAMNPGSSAARPTLGCRASLLRSREERLFVRGRGMSSRSIGAPGLPSARSRAGTGSGSHRRGSAGASPSRGTRDVPLLSSLTGLVWTRAVFTPPPWKRGAISYRP